MNTKLFFKSLANLSLCLVSLWAVSCSKASVNNSSQNLMEEEQVLVQSSFYPGEMNPQAAQRYGSSLAETSTAFGSNGSDGGVIAPPTGSTGGSDTGSIPAPGSSGGSSNPGGSTGSTTPPAGGSTDPVTPPSTGGNTGTVDNTPPSTPSTPAQPNTPTGNDPAPSTPPATGGTDGGTVVGGGSTPSTPDTGTVNPGGATPNNPPANPGDTAQNGGTGGSSPSTPTTPSNPSTPTTPTDPSGGTTTPPTTTPGGGSTGPVVNNPPPAGGNDGGTVPGGNNPGTPGDGGTTPVPPPVTAGMDVELHRVCSQVRSTYKYPKFVFFEEATRPIMTFETAVDTKKMVCVTNSVYTAAAKKSQVASLGLSALFMDRMERTESKLVRLLFDKIDLSKVDLSLKKYATSVQFRVDQAKALFPNTWMNIILNAGVCDDTSRDGSCMDEPTVRNLLANAATVKLGQLPSKLNLYVWANRSKLLKTNPKSCEQQYSPLVLDLGGNGFALTGPEQGMWFDLNDTGEPVMTGWVRGKDDAFLVRDLNNNGMIDSGAELFGSATRLKDGSRAANGFAALAELDSNGDGVISSADEQWSNLRLWIDANFNGQSEASELRTLSSAKVESIRVDYIDLMEVDRYGNQTRQRSTFRQTVNGVSTARMVIDVWFNTLVAE